MLYDDPSYVDESTNAPYMKNAERKQEIHRKRVERKFNGKEDPADKDGGGIAKISFTYCRLKQ